MIELHFHKQQHKVQAVQASYLANANKGVWDFTVDQIKIHKRLQNVTSRQKHSNILVLIQHRA